MYQKISHKKIDGTYVEENGVLLIETNSYIPFDESNTDYQEYLAWVAEGNEPEPADTEGE